MKILQINKYYYLKGGADGVFFNTINLLRSHGNDVIPFCTADLKNIDYKYKEYFVNSPEIRNQNSIEKIKGIGRFLYNKKAAAKLEDLIEKTHPDIAHLHNIFNGLSMSILPVLKKHHIPVVITMHDTRFICPSSYFMLRGNLCKNCYKGFYLNCALHKCYQDNLLYSFMCTAEMIQKNYFFNYNQYVNKYIFVSYQFKKFHEEIHPFFKEKGTVLYNYFLRLNKSLPEKKKGNYFFYYGRITKEKGVETLLKAFASLPNMKLKLAGTGPLLDELKKKYAYNVEFLGFVSGEPLFDLVKNSSFVIVPSEWQENNPLTIVESYSLGKPVLGSRIGGIPEIIEEGKTGLVFEPFSVESLKDCIKKAYTIGVEEYEMMSSNAREFAEKNFNPETHYERLMEIYNQVIKENESI